MGLGIELEWDGEYLNVVLGGETMETYSREDLKQLIITNKKHLEF